MWWKKHTQEGARNQGLPLTIVSVGTEPCATPFRLGVRDLQVELKPPDVTPSNFQTRH
jgi:hypothetical protein